MILSQATGGSLRGDAAQPLGEALATKWRGTAPDRRFQRGTCPISTCDRPPSAKISCPVM